MIARMVERSFSDRFVSLSDRFWRSEWTLFFRSRAENAAIAHDAVDAFRGLKYSVIFLDGANPHLAADIRTRYIGRSALSDCGKEDREGALREHVRSDAPWERRPTFVRDNGARKITCKFAGDAPGTIAETVFGEAGESVLSYYQRTYPAVEVRPTDPAAWVQDRPDSAAIPCPSSRLFPVFTTEYAGVRSCSVRPQMTPVERVSSISSFIRELGSVSYADRSLRTSQDHYSGPRTVFVPPRLQFGANFTLQIPEGESQGEALDEAIIHWGSRKMPALYAQGPFHFEPVPDPILLYPSSLDRGSREEFIRALSGEIQRQTGRALAFQSQRSYPIGPGQRGGSSLLAEASKIPAEAGRHLVVVILWDQLKDRVHGDLKEIFKATYSQCVTETVAVDVARRSTSRWPSRLRNVALAILTEAGGQPWVLTDPLNGDVHIGIDVLFGRVGYNFLYDIGGRKVFRESGWATQGGRAKEAIKRLELSQKLVTGFRKVAASSGRIRCAVIHRDGRWWPSESQGLKHALAQAKVEGLLDAGFTYVVVEVRKHHAPVRLLTQASEAGRVLLRNPLPGSYLALDDHRLVLATTGRPGTWDSAGGRTAGTLLLNVVESNGAVNLMSIGEDAYKLTHLNWSAPDIELSLPVTIRWADEALRETLQPPDVDTEEGREVEESDHDAESVEVNEQ